MTSPRRRQGRPIEAVELRISFRANRETSIKIREAIPYAKIRGGICEVRIQAEEPSAVAERAKEVLERVRTIGGLG